jgi:hypothetical protein
LDGRDRRRVPIAQDRLERRADGKLELGFKKVWRAGTRALVLEPADIIPRLVAAVQLNPPYPLLGGFWQFIHPTRRRAIR